jgi:hypothetical protein
MMPITIEQFCDVTRLEAWTLDPRLRHQNIIHKRPSRRLFALLCISLALSCSGCGGPITAKEALHAASLFLEAILVLEKASNLFGEGVNAAVSTTKDQLQTDQKVVLSKVALEWEKNWKVVVDQTATLEENFKQVESASNEYWRVLEEVTANIEDKSLRAVETEKNKQARAKWDRAYEQAAKVLARAKDLRDKGNDIGRTMLTSALRGQLAEYTATLDSIASDAERLLRSLGIITEQGKLIVSSMQR